MKTFLTVVQSIGLLVARIALGIVMVNHGWARWTNPGLSAQVELLATAGIAQPQLVAWGTMLLEVVGGVLLIFGAFTPAVAALYLVQQILVIALVKWPHGLAIESGGFEFNVVLAAVAALLLVFGAGRVGADALFRRPASETGPRAGKQVDDHAPA